MLRLPQWLFFLWLACKLLLVFAICSEIYLFIPASCGGSGVGKCFPWRNLYVCAVFLSWSSFMDKWKHFFGEREKNCLAFGHELRFHHLFIFFVLLFFIVVVWIGLCKMQTTLWCFVFFLIERCVLSFSLYKCAPWNSLPCEKHICIAVKKSSYKNR